MSKRLKQSNKNLKDILGNPTFLKSLTAANFVDPDYGVLTVEDILKELEKPGRDPRPQFKMANFKKEITGLNDLKIGMILEGIVTNVANFGAFVDIGVHQDGLIHISAMADKFIKDPREVVKANDIVTVKVLEIDIPRKRIALTLRLQDKAFAVINTKAHNTAVKPNYNHNSASTPSTLGSALLSALAAKAQS